MYINFAKIVYRFCTEILDFYPLAWYLECAGTYGAASVPHLRISRLFLAFAGKQTAQGEERSVSRVFFGRDGSIGGRADERHMEAAAPPVFRRVKGGIA